MILYGFHLLDIVLERTQQENKSSNEIKHFLSMKKTQYYFSEICMLEVQFPNENVLKSYSRWKEQ